MSFKRVATISLSVLTVLSLYQDAATARPDKTVQLIMRGVPEDSGSPIIQTASIELIKYYTGAGYIEWKPESVTINEVDQFGNVLATWRGTDLAFDTPSGLWSVDHLDTLAPADSEFALPPFLLGTAFSDDPSLFAWDFEILGDIYHPLIHDAETGGLPDSNSGTAPGNSVIVEMEDEDDPDDQPYSS